MSHGEELDVFSSPYRLCTGCRQRLSTLDPHGLCPGCAVVSCEVTARCVDCMSLDAEGFSKFLLYLKKRSQQQAFRSASSRSLLLVPLRRLLRLRLSPLPWLGL